MNQRPFTTLALVLLTGWCASLVSAGESTVEAADTAAPDYQDSWGPATGTGIPPLDAQDQNGAQRDLASLTGDRGLVIAVNRSAVW